MKKVLSLISLTLLIFTAAVGQTREERKVPTFTKISFRVPGKLYLRQGSPQKVELEGSRDFLAEIETEVSGDNLTIGKDGGWMGWNWGTDDRVNVYITVANIEGLSVSGSGDLIGETRINADNLDLNVSGSGSLKIEADASGNIEADVSGSGSIELTGKCKNFKSDVSGSGRVRMTETIAGRASFGVSGSGKIEASGTADEVKTSISGSGKVYAANLEADRCEVRISGSGDVEINVKSELDATISGSGSVSYKGNPSHVNTNASGSGKVRKL
ncbi:MAG: head GIN domain-containing protein [Bacteroidota bacterium]